MDALRRSEERSDGPPSDECSGKRTTRRDGGRRTSPLGFSMGDVQGPNEQRYDERLLQDPELQSMLYPAPRRADPTLAGPPLSIEHVTAGIAGIAESVAGLSTCSALAGGGTWRGRS